MKAGVVHGIEDIRYEDIETPKVEPGKVLVKIKYTGICGSDIPRVNQGTAHYTPIVLGHEFSGTVAEVGEGVTSVKAGDRVRFGETTINVLWPPKGTTGDNINEESKYN